MAIIKGNGFGEFFISMTLFGICHWFSIGNKYNFAQIDADTILAIARQYTILRVPPKAMAELWIRQGNWHGKLQAYLENRAILPD